MAVGATMGGSGTGTGTDDNEKKPFFHDFFGMNSSGAPPSFWAMGASESNRASEPVASLSVSAASVSVGLYSGGHGFVSGCSDLGSERRGLNNPEVFHFPGRKSDISGTEFGCKLSGRKRSYHDLPYTCLLKDRCLPASSDSFESSRMSKMPGKDVVRERLASTRDDDIMFSVQPPLRPTSVLLHPSCSSRPDSLMSKWDRSMPVNLRQILQPPSCYAQSGTYAYKVSPLHLNRDTSVGATIITQSAADEGSRTGFKGSGVLEIINLSSDADQRNSTGILPRSKVSKDNEPESCNLTRRHATASAGHQMTIFYAGQAHVFDDVHPNKADVIMALAGSNGGSWTTTYSPRPSDRPTMSEAEACTQDEIHGKFPLNISRNLDIGSNQVSQMQATIDAGSLEGNKSCLAVGDGGLMSQAAEPSA